MKTLSSSPDKKSSCRENHSFLRIFPALIVTGVAGLFNLQFPGTAMAASAPDTGYGPHPVLPEPSKSILQTVHIAPAKGWPANAKPVAADGLAVDAYARGLDHPRWLYTLPNGDVLVAETNSPPQPENNKGIKGWFAKHTQKSAGAGTATANRITLLRGIDAAGLAVTRTAFLEQAQGLNSPFGMALIGHDLYIANTDAILRFPYQDGQTQIRTAGVKVADLPAGPINHHWTKNILASQDGARLYVTVGSNSNAAENGIAQETNRASILALDLASGKLQVFASGLRNPNGLGWEPQSGALWTAVNERDALGDNLVPDYMTSVRDGAFYGWPYSYFGQHVDVRVKPQRPDLVAKAIAPDYALGAHTASLGLVFYTAQLLPEQYRGGVFIGQHGSWNRAQHSGYKVIFVPFSNGQPSGPVQDVLTGFLSQEGNAYGRPVGVAVDSKGALLVADDVGNIVWRVTPKMQSDTK
jgi:glucose/arabinose dehydrogenase